MEASSGNVYPGRYAPFSLAILSTRHHKAGDKQCRRLKHGKPQNGLPRNTYAFVQAAINREK